MHPLEMAMKILVTASRGLDTFNITIFAQFHIGERSLNAMIAAVTLKSFPHPNSAIFTASKGRKAAL